MQKVLYGWGESVYKELRIYLDKGWTVVNMAASTQAEGQGQFSKMYDKFMVILEEPVSDKS